MQDNNTLLQNDTILTFSDNNLTRKSKKKSNAIKSLLIVLLLISFLFKSKKIQEKHDDENQYEENIDFSNYKSDIKALALYLPEFYENYTEWRSVKKAKPCYKNHNQPRVPHSSFGYYDLSEIDTLKKQVQLAKQHGIYGFAIYYYWFGSDSNSIYKNPMDMFLLHKEINFNFMLIWANSYEDKSKKEDINDKSKDVLKEDGENFMIDISKYLNDSRYIRVNGRPVIGIHSPKNIPNLLNVIIKWRKTARILGIGEIFIWNCINEGSAKDLGFSYIFDGEYEFPPLNKTFTAEQKSDNGISFNYENLVDASKNWPKMEKDFPVFRGIMGEWDNSPQRKNNYNNWDNFSNEKFYIYNKITIEWTRRNHNKENRFIFINAWNDWGKGTYLEPDTKYGFAMINSFSKAIFDLNFKDEENFVVYIGSGTKNFTQTKKVAVQAHVFYIDLIGEIVDSTNNIPIPFDLYITTVSFEYYEVLKNYVEKYSKAEHYEIIITENKGRDVLPFIKQMRNKIENYDYLCHIHTKRSTHMSSGEAWRRYLFENLLGSSDIISEIFNIFEENEAVGVIYPQNIDFLARFLNWGGCKENCEMLLSRMFGGNITLNGIPEFPAGDMFWAKVKSVQQLFEIDIKDEEFPEEGGELNGTIMHAIERVWLFLAKMNGYSYRKVRSIFDKRSLFVPLELKDGMPKTDVNITFNTTE